MVTLDYGMPTNREGGQVCPFVKKGFFREEGIEGAGGAFVSIEAAARRYRVTVAGA